MKMTTFWENERRKLLGQPLIADDDTQANTAIDAPQVAVLAQAEEEINKVKNISVYVVMSQHQLRVGGGQILGIHPTPSGFDNAIVLLTVQEAKFFAERKLEGISIGSKNFYAEDDIFHIHIRTRIGIAYLVDDMFAFWEKHEKYKTCWLGHNTLMWNSAKRQPDYHTAEHSIEMYYNQLNKTIRVKKSLIASDGYDNLENPKQPAIAHAVSLQMVADATLHTHGINADIKYVETVFNYTINDCEISPKNKLIYPTQYFVQQKGLQKVDTAPHVPSSADFTASKNYNHPSVMINSEAIWLFYSKENSVSVKISKELWH
jgi:hypothetical protein